MTWAATGFRSSRRRQRSVSASAAASSASACSLQPPRSAALARAPEPRGGTVVPTVACALVHNVDCDALGTEAPEVSGNSWIVGAPVHPRLVDEPARLAERGVSAAEARRRIAPLAARLGVSRPGYTAVLEIVQTSQPPSMPAPGSPSVVDSLVLGRAPTPREAESTAPRARVHMHGLRARRRR